MDPANPPKQDKPEEPRFLDFPHLPDHASQDGKPLLNKYSSTITRGHAFPGAQVVKNADWHGQADTDFTRQCCMRPECLIRRP